VELRESDRLRSRIYALDLRIAEMDRDLRRAQIRVHHLKARLDDAVMARLFGDEAGDPTEIGPELERSRVELESHREAVERVKKRRREARAAYWETRLQERREQGSTDA